MTVATTTNKSIGEGNGLTTTFPFTFGTLPTGDLVVTLFDPDGVEYPQTEVTDYTVLGEGSEDGGAIVFLVAPPANYTVLIQRVLPYTQPTDFKNQGTFYPKTHERSFDRVTMQVQQLDERVQSSMTLPPQVTGVSTTLPAPEANTLFGWNPDANAIQNFPLSTIATSIVYGNKVYQVFTGTGAQVDFPLSQDPGSLGNLDVSIDGVTQVPTADYTYATTTLSFTSAPANNAVILVRYDIAVPVGASTAAATQYTGRGTGAVMRDIQERVREIISATDYFSPSEKAQLAAGTLGDFTTSIQKAIDHAETFAGTGGAVVHFPAGKFGYTTLTIEANNVVLKCDGEAYLIKMATTGNGLVVGNQVGRTYGVELRGFQIGSSVTGVSGNLVSFINVGQCGVFDLTQTAAFGVPFIGLRVTNASQFTFSNQQWQDCGSDGVVFEDMVDLYMDNSRSDSHDGAGFVYNKIGGCYANNVTAYDNGTSAHSVLNTYGSPVLATQNQHWFLDNVIGDTSGSHNINITQLSQARLNVWAATQRNSTVNLHGLNLANCIDVELYACTGTNNNGIGLNVQSTCSHIRVVGGGYHGNGVQAGSTNRVGIYSDNVDITYMGVTMTDDLRAAIPLALVQQYGLKVTGAALVRLIGCNLRGNAVGPFDVPSSGANVKEYGCDDNASTTYASANPTTTVGAIGDVFEITGTADIYDIRPRWKGRRLKLSFTSTARLMDKTAGAAFALPTPAVQPGAFGTACIFFNGTNWLLESFSVNDGV